MSIILPHRYITKIPIQFPNRHINFQALFDGSYSTEFRKFIKSDCANSHFSYKLYSSDAGNTAQKITAHWLPVFLKQTIQYLRPTIAAIR